MSKSKNKPHIAISLGDPRGVGPEIVAQCVSALSESADLIIFGDPHILPNGAHTQCQIISVSNDPQWRSWDDKTCGQHSMAYVAAATKYCLQNLGTTLVTAPINKHRWHQACGKVIGHTEYLQHLCQASTVGMMMISPRLRAVPVTIHIPVADVAHVVTSELIIQQATLTVQFLKQKLGIQIPKIAITGLNPHAGDNGSIGQEEITIIAPAILELQRQGIQAAGPFPADTIFTAEQRKNWDAILAMTHDQALIPAKALDFENTVNVTMGLPFVRTSPDHGTAEDIAWQGKANAQHMRAAIEMALTLARRAE